MKKVAIIDGQTLMDVVLRQYVTVEALFDIAALNGISLEADIPAGLEIVLNEAAVYPDFFAEKITSEPINTPTMVSGGQCLVDLAIQETGSLEGLFGLAALNGLLITEGLTAGQVLLCSPEIKPDLVKYFADRKQRINTGSSAAILGDDPDGIFWVDGDGAYITNGNDDYILAEL